MPQRTVAHPVVMRAAQVVPASINETDHTAEVVFTTGAQVRRYDWMEGGEYIEELEVSEQALDLSRLNSGAPYLDSHRSWETDAIAGAVESARIENGEGRARIRFDVEGEVGKEQWRKVKARFLNFVSVGYTVERYQEFMRDGRRVLRAVRWTPVEISGVAVPADAGAGFRKADATTPCTIERDETGNNGGNPMPGDPNNPNPPANPPATPPAGQPDEATRAAELAANQARAAMQRQDEIMELCAMTGRSIVEARTLIAGAKSVEEIRKEFVNARAAAGGADVSGHQPGGAGTDQGEFKPGMLRAQMEKTLKARGMTPSNAALQEA